LQLPERYSVKWDLSFAEALRVCTEPSVPGFYHKNPFDPVRPIIQPGVDAQIYRNWLREHEFLPHRDAKMWATIKEIWLSYISATSYFPNPQLAPNEGFASGKGAAVVLGKGVKAESLVDMERRFSQQLFRKMKISREMQLHYEHLDEFSEAWPLEARRIVNRCTNGPDAGPVLGMNEPGQHARLMRCSSVLSCMISFLLYCKEAELLEDMGLNLDHEQAEDIMDILTGHVFPGQAFLNTRELVMMTLDADIDANCQNNILLWWIGVLIKSAVETSEMEIQTGTASHDVDGLDFISRGRFANNHMPMDFDLNDKLDAIIHFAKIAILNEPPRTLSQSGKDTDLDVVIEDIDKLDISWIRDGRLRPVGQTGKHRLNSPGWEKVFRQLQTSAKYGLDSPESVVGRLCELLRNTNCQRATLSHE